MLRSEMIEALSELYPSLRHYDIKKAVDCFFGVIAQGLCDNKRVELRKFGVFEVRHRLPRLGRNPKTDEPVQVEEKFVPFFRAGRVLNQELNPESVSDE